MEIRFNVTGAARKALVEAIGGIVGWAPVYTKAPTFAYVVHNYTIDKNGTLICDERTDSGDVHHLLTELVERGFVYEDISGQDAPVPVEDSPTDAPLTEDGEAGSEAVSAGVDPAGDAPVEAAPTGDDPDRLVVEVPLDGFTATALDNLDKLVASKAALIKKSLGASDLPIERESDRLRFPWFTLGASRDEVAVYTQFVHMLCEMAKTQKRVVAKEKPADSEKFAFRCFLLRLGYIGGEYAAARKLLLANLPGDGSFKSGKRKERDGDSEAAAQAANAADNGGGAGAGSCAGEDGFAADSAGTGGVEGAYSLAEALADAELIHGVNKLFENEMAGGGADE